MFKPFDSYHVQNGVARKLSNDNDHADEKALHAVDVPCNLFDVLAQPGQEDGPRFENVAIYASWAEDLENAPEEDWAALRECLRLESEVVSVAKDEGSWVAFSPDGRRAPLLSRRTEQQAMEDGQRFWNDHGTPERTKATERRERVAFLAKLWGEE